MNKVQIDIKTSDHRPSLGGTLILRDTRPNIRSEAKGHGLELFDIKREWEEL